jgi:starch synthase (maltosyl-transferring)
VHVKKDKRRVVIESVKPEIDAGRFSIKRTVGERVTVEADIFADGHEAVSAVLMYRKDSDAAWTEVPMEPLVNDRWRAEFPVTQMGRYSYTLQGWLDHFRFWSRALAKRIEAAQDLGVDLLIGAALVEEASAQAEGDAGARLRDYAARLRAGGSDAIDAALSPALAALMYAYSERKEPTTYEHELGVIVDPERARFSTWYELFPRSRFGATAGHGTFKDVEERLPYVADMGFDVLYLPPIHPIGAAHRKGKNNSVTAEPGDIGSPWAIGAPEGGHKGILADLGTLDDFRSLVARAKEFGVDIALDIAFQTSPDHPYVREHPEWFRTRPDGTIQYAENPPKKYQDIYPFDFETVDWQAMWDELKSVVLYWIEQGVTIFRVDNPHTKSLRFWEWLIADVKHDHPETIFLAEAFTRPKVMYYLAKSGFTQSYNYFAWRNTKWELTEYFTELTKTDVREFFRPNLWPNTPDILTEHLQMGGRPAFITRLVLAATLGASYGIYGPAFELCVNEPIAHGKEEYLDSEKFELKQWDVTNPDSLGPLITRVNAARHENRALQSNEGLRFLNTSNDQIIAYYKATPTLDNVILTIVNLDPNYTQSGFVELPLADLGLDPQQPYQMHDLLTDTRYLWSGSHNFVELNPRAIPAHVFRVRKHVRREQDFDYYL